MRIERRLLIPTLLVLFVIGASACASRKAPVVEPLRAQANRKPVIFIPGLGGSRLRDAETGEILWGSSHKLFFPRDGSYELARSIVPGSDARDDVEAYDVIDRLKLLGFIPIDIYAPLLEALEANGYRRGDLSEPGPDDTLFIHAYDPWRDLPDTARLLGEGLERLRVARGVEVLEVDLIGHSNGALIARWFLKYGGGELADAESGTTAPPSGIRVDKLILAGPLNTGGAATLEDLHRGRRYVPLVGRRVRPEVIFTLRSAWTMLPTRTDDLFFDPEGTPLEVDLFDAGTWRQYEWGIHRPKVTQRMAEDPGLFGDTARQEEFLTEMLEDARMLHRLLGEDAPGFRDSRYYIVRSGDPPSDKRIVLVPRGDGWKTRIEKLPEGASSPEGGETGLSPQEQQAIAGRREGLPVGHRYLLRDTEAIRAILGFLSE